MKIGILCTGRAPASLRSLHGDYGSMFRRLLAGNGLELQEWDVENRHFPTTVHAADGWLITGSRHGVYEDHPFIPPLEDFILAARQADVVMVGVCFGHQVMAQALGGRVDKFAGGWAVGPQQYSFAGERLTLNAWHQDQVTEPPPGAQCVAGNDFCRYAALVYGHWGFSVQPHPEFSRSFMREMLTRRGPELVPGARLRTAIARLDAPLDQQRLAGLMIRFFRRRHLCLGGILQAVPTPEVSRR
ncbi:type 1 glutamine amidotransferase [Desulfurivibrio dismutans]|uniref:type 1 glutamine amidotransferase n=1 Tax=Desulfurivibrio dismutans TaxID=1398908 RepID=UPI0023DA3816|nr:type 1 glutamine amidotransferase [Desulfurivibrio alkaliphilus]MDF1614095.1 type 1 glutamine amidotransferase [Desulfurivibrio alkaliphilus]